MDKLVAIRIKHDDGTYSNEIPLSVLAINIDWDGTHSLVDVLGNVDLNKGSIQEQINALTTTITPDNVQYDLTHTLSDVLGDVDLDKGDLQTQIDNISDGEIQVDSTLTVAGKAADAKAVGDNLKNVVRVGNSNVTNFTSIILGDTAEHINLLDQSDLIGINTRLSALENGDIQVDQTLSVQGMAADAKATGDAIHNLRGLVGTPLVAATAASMTNTDKIYVYTGSETGYTNGNWYYYDGIVWVSGGVYNSIAINMDTVPTLESSNPVTSAGIKTTLDSVDSEIDELKNDLNDVKSNSSAFTNLFAQSGISKNLFNPKTIRENTAVRVTNGTLYASTGSAVSNFIPVKAGKKYSFFKIISGTVSLAVAGRVVAYDKNGVFKSSIGEINSSNKTRTIPSDGTVYVRIMYNMTSYSDADALMFVEVADETVPSVFSVYGETDFRISDYAKSSEVAQTNAKLDKTIENFEEVTDILNVDVSEMTGGTLTTGKLIGTNGALLDNVNYQVLKQEVNPNTNYWITAEAYYNTSYFYYYDANDNPISEGKKISTDAGVTRIIKYKSATPSNASYILVSSKIESNVQAVYEFEQYEIPASTAWINKKWVVVGDSITQVNAATTKHYYEYIADETGISVSNMGVGGTGYVRGYNNNNAFYQRIASVPSDADIVTIFGSGNDCNIEAMPMFDGMTWAQALGTYTDNTVDTICGCVNATLDAFFTAMVTTPIGIIAPSPWKTYPTTKLTNNRFEDYVSALKQIAAYRGVPFLDLYHGSNLRPENEANCNACFYNSGSLDGNGDGVHPNALGHKIIAPKIFEFVKMLLLY